MLCTIYTNYQTNLSQTEKTNLKKKISGLQIKSESGEWTAEQLQCADSVTSAKLPTCTTEMEDVR